MSKINTNGIDVNYPIPGINNTSQGMRDNFSSIKTNIDTASTEITELQQKVILKAALSDTTINNDMSGTLISNASVKGFRTTSYNLGSAISGTTIVDLTKADVQFGTIIGNTTLQFGGWSPNGTQGKIQLLLTVANTNAYVTFPQTTCDSGGRITTGMKFSTRFLESYTSNGSPSNNSVYTNVVSIPKDVTVLHYEFSSEDCGTTIEVTPINRSQQASQITSRTPTNMSNVSATGNITCSTTSTTVTGIDTLFQTELVVGRTILSSSNVVIGKVATISSNTSLTLTTNASVTVSDNSYNRQLAIGNSGDVPGTISSDDSALYICTGTYDGVSSIWKKVLLSNL